LCRKTERVVEASAKRCIPYGKRYVVWAWLVGDVEEKVEVATDVGFVEDGAVAIN
jgi:hypothetical protein